MAASRYHTDHPSEDDHLYFSDFRPVLHEILLHANTPLTIGVFGPWGSGKTTLLRMLRRDIEALSLPNLRTVWFTAWKYDKDEALWRAFILRVLDALYPRVAGTDPWEERQHLPIEAMNAKQRKEAEQLRRLQESVYRPVDWKELGGWLLDWGKALPAVMRGSTEIAAALFPPAAPIKPVLKLLGGNDAVADEWETMITAFRQEVHAHHLEQLTSMEQFEGTFRETLQLILVDEKNPGATGRLIVFIDDLDRCLPEKAVEILETVKLFLEVEGVVFVLGMDKQVIERGIDVRYRAMLPNGIEQNRVISGDTYLEKIIQIPFLLPAMGDDDIDQFIHFLENGNTLERVTDEQIRHEQERLTRELILSTTTQRVFRQGIRPNPRQIKRALNIFRLLQGIALIREWRGRLPFGSVSWTLLAKTVVIQLQFPEVYQAWRQEPQLIRWLEEIFRKQLLKADLEPKDQTLVEPFVNPEQWQYYRLLERLLIYPAEPVAKDKRDLAHFTGLGLPDLTLYLQLAGTVAVEDAMAEELGEVWQQILTGVPERISTAIKTIQNANSSSQSELVQWTLRQRLSKVPEIFEEHLYWADALRQLGDVQGAGEVFVRARQTKQTEVRLLAVKLLAQLPSAEAPKQVAGFITDQNELVRQTASDLLIEMGQMAVGPLLSTLYSTSYPPTRDIVIRALAQLHAYSLDTIVQILRRESFPDVSQAVNVTSGLLMGFADGLSTVLQLIGEPAIKALIALLSYLELEQSHQLAQIGVAPFTDHERLNNAQDWPWIVVVKAITSLPTQSVPALFDALRTQKAPVQAITVNLLYRIEDTRIIESTLDFLNTSPPITQELYRDLSRGLIRFGAAAVQPLLREISRGDENAAVDIRILLEEIGEVGIPDLLAALAENDPYIWVTSITVLSTFFQKGFVQANQLEPAIIACLTTEEHPAVLQAAIKAAEAIESSLAREPVYTLLAHNDSAVRALAALLLGRLTSTDDEKSFQALMSLARSDQEMSVRANAIKGLASIQRSDIVPLLLDELEHNDVLLHPDIIEALVVTKDPRVLNPLLKRLKADQDPVFLSRLINSLVSLGDSRAAKHLERLGENLDNRSMQLLQELQDIKRQIVEVQAQRRRLELETDRTRQLYEQTGAPQLHEQIEQASVTHHNLEDRIALLVVDEKNMRLQVEQVRSLRSNATSALSTLSHRTTLSQLSKADNSKRGFWDRLRNR